MSTGRWRPAGRFDHGPVTHLALSPWFAADRCAVAVTPAGGWTSRDGGLTWDSEVPAQAWPLVTGLAVGSDRTLVATTIGGVRFSRDWGDTWHDLPGVTEATAIASLDDGTFILADGGGGVFSGDLGERRLDLLSTIPDSPFRIGRAGGRIYALGDRFLVSDDGGMNWTAAITTHAANQFADIAVVGERSLALAEDGAGLWSVGPNEAAALGLPDVDCNWTTIATSRSGRTVVLGGDRAVAVSVDSGDSWLVRAVGQPVVSVAVGGEVAGLAAGLADGSILVSRDKGQSWSVFRIPGGTVVTRLRVTGQTVRAMTIEGTELECRLGEVMTDWRPCPQAADHLHSVPVIPELNGEIVAAVHGPDGEAFAVGSRSEKGACAVWTPGFDGRWRKLAAHPESARVVALTPSSPLYAGIGDSVYRPWRGGIGLAAREQVDPERVSEVLAIDGRDVGPLASVVVALTDAGFYRSDEDGLSWSSLGAPDGAPVTAFTVIDDHGGLGILAVQSGGTLVALRLNDVGR